MSLQSLARRGVAEDAASREAFGTDSAAAILLEVVDSMTAAGDVTRALHRLARLALRASGADRCAILVRDPHGDPRLLPAAAAARSGDPEELWKRFREMEPIDVGSDPARLSLWDSPHAVTLDDAARSDLVPEVWRREWGSKSLAFVTLRASGETFGLLAVEFVERPHRFTASEASLLEAVASAGGVALRSAGLVGRLTRALAVERRLIECTSELIAGRSLAEALDLIAEGFTSLLDGASCSINLLSTDARGFRRVAARGISSTVTEWRIEDLPTADVGMIAETWRIDPRSPVRIPDVRVHTEWRDFIPSEIGTGLLLALRESDGIIGFVAVGRSEDPFTDEEVEVATAFADQASLAVGQAWLNESLATRLRVIEALNRLSDAVGRTSRLRTLLRALNREVCADIGVECRRVSFADLELQEVLACRRPTRRDLSLIHGWAKRSDASIVSFGSDIAVPVPMGNRVVGVLWIRTEGPVDVAKLGLIKSVAAGLGEVASKARLRRTADRRTRELAVAAERERIARDLHDTVGQTLYGMGLGIQDALHDIRDPQLAERLARVRDLAARGVADVRSAVYALSFLDVRARGLVPSLRALVRQFAGETGIAADLRVGGKPKRLSETVESALYRTAHEALVNVERHARATGVAVLIEFGDRVVELEVRDDGVGLDQRQVPDWRSVSHFGMRTMAKTVAAAGGRFTVSPGHPRGLIIRAVLPVGRKTTA